MDMYRGDQMKTFLRAVIVGGIVLALPYGARATGLAEPAQPAAQVSAADAAPFLGEWALALEGPNGPANMTLSVTAEKEKVSAELGSEVMGKQPISTIALVGKGLVLNYSFNYEGNAVDAVVSLTPDKEGKTAAQIDFAGGAYVLAGTATKKEAAK
jgi:hypothetical protein